MSHQMFILDVETFSYDTRNNSFSIKYLGKVVESCTLMELFVKIIRTSSSPSRSSELGQVSA